MDNKPDLNFGTVLPAPAEVNEDITPVQKISEEVNSSMINSEQPTDNTVNGSNNPSEFKIVDNDLIDKEWVDKVKKILNETKGNPYQQSVEVNRLKIEFLKQKYNKIIKA